MFWFFSGADLQGGSPTAGASIEIWRGWGRRRGGGNKKNGERERKKKRLASFNLVLHPLLVFQGTFRELEHTGSNITLTTSNIVKCSNYLRELIDCKTISFVSSITITTCIVATEIFVHFSWRRTWQRINGMEPAATSARWSLELSPSSSLIHHQVRL